MPSPFEIVAAPGTVWAAAVGTAYPDIGETPSASWSKLGTNGDKNISEDGISLKSGQKLEFFRVLGSTGAVKAARVEESLVGSFTMFDMTLEQLKRAFNSNTVTDVAAVAGVAGYRSMPLYRGLDVTQMALLIRFDASPYADSMKLEARIPRVVHSGEPELVGKKDEPMGVLMEFTTIEDPDYAGGKFGEILAQDAVAL